MSLKTFPKPPLISCFLGDFKTLEQLAHNVDATIRRSVARNLNTPSGILLLLANDPVMNISYMVSSNPNCYDKKDSLDLF